MASTNKLSCKSCSQELKSKDKYFKCTNCSQSFHSGCIGLSKNAATIIGGAQGQFAWSCQDCVEARNSVSTLEAGTMSISSLSEQIKSLTQRMEALETRENSEDKSSVTSFNDNASASTAPQTVTTKKNFDTIELSQKGEGDRTFNNRNWKGRRGNRGGFRYHDRGYKHSSGGHREHDMYGPQQEPQVRPEVSPGYHQYGGYVNGPWGIHVPPPFTGPPSYFRPF